MRNHLTGGERLARDWQAFHTNLPLEVGAVTFLLLIAVVNGLLAARLLARGFTVAERGGAGDRVGSGRYRDRALGSGVAGLPRPFALLLAAGLALGSLLPLAVIAALVFSPTLPSL